MSINTHFENFSLLFSGKGLEKLEDIDAMGRDIPKVANVVERES